MNFVGEGADDYSGPYHESISVMADELNKHLPLFVPTPNGQLASSKKPAWDPEFKGEKNKILNGRLASDAFLKLYKFVGVLMGISIRNSAPIKLRLAPLTWKMIAGEHVALDDFKAVDQGFYNCADYLLGPSADLFLDHLSAHADGERRGARSDRRVASERSR